MTTAAAHLTISGLARAGGVGVETVRYYQRRGLLKCPVPTDIPGAKIRRYGADDLRRLRFIRSAQAAGFTLAQIRELLDLDSTHDRPRAGALARERVMALDAEIARLKAARNALKRLADACGHGAKGPCPILTAFEHTRPKQGRPKQAGPKQTQR